MSKKTPSGKGRWAKRKNKYKVKDEIYERLISMLKKGEGNSKHEDKINGGDFSKIYSFNTFQTYHRESKKFANWAKKHDATKNIKRLDDLLPFVNDYLRHLITEKYSAWSISTSKAALSKLFQVPSTYFVETPARQRKDIKRGRNHEKSSERISKETEAIFEKFTSATGLRRNELANVRGIDLVQSKSGHYFVRVSKGTKGGKVRIALILGETEEETDEIVQFFKKQGKLKLFTNIPKHLNNHQYRAAYAKRVYNKFARDVTKLEKSERYEPRGDMKGQWLDRRAMSYATRYLGHQRISEIAKSYLC